MCYTCPCDVLPMTMSPGEGRLPEAGGGRGGGGGGGLESSMRFMYESMAVSSNSSSATTSEGGPPPSCCNAVEVPHTYARGGVNNTATREVGRASRIAQV